jgi:hypothetical protein
MKMISISKLKIKKVKISPLLMQLYAFSACGKTRKKEGPT